MRTALADVIAGALLLAVTAYSTAGGVDFGAGIWDLLAGRKERGRRARELIDHAMAPVWEVNNVWLVLAIVVCWTGFPSLFQAAFSSLYPLYTLALLGLILRGAFFAFRHVAGGQSERRLADLVFGVSSVLTPFFFAASLGAIASGHLEPWGPMPVAFGLVSLAATAFSGASFLVGDARRHAPELVDYFRRRALAAALALVVLGTLALVVIAAERPQLLVAMFTTAALPFVLAAMVFTPLAAGLLWRRVFKLYRLLTVAAVGSLVIAWGVAQSPYLLPGRLTIEQAAAPGATEVLLIVVAAGVALVIGPAIGLLLYLDQRSLLRSPEA
ncbi:MAG: cytochrome d ubiquinol oxidase subunit II [Chloroflexi bacterium]|nr:MAG: cytochrome d ubiquinol oxidase subunit II [Chloroflexota bacterium]